MTTNDTGDWRELFEVALFEPERVKMRQRIDHARDAIHNRIEDLLERQKPKRGSISEHIALRDALTTLADLNKIACGRKPSGSVSGEGGRATTR